MVWMDSERIQTNRALAAPPDKWRRNLEMLTFVALSLHDSGKESASLNEILAEYQILSGSTLSKPQRQDVRQCLGLHPLFVVLASQYRLKIT
jgi:hypothetical protein